MPRRNEIPQGIRSTVVDLHMAGKGYKVISKSLDIHHSTVRQIIYKWKRFNTVATLPRSGRPSKKTPKTQRNPGEPDDASAGPADDRGGDLDHEMQYRNVVPEAAKNVGSSISDTEASDKDPTAVRVSAGPAHVKEEDPHPDTSDYNIVSEVGENAESPSSDIDEEDPMASYLSGRPADNTGGDPDPDKRRGESGSASSDDDTTEDPMLFDPNFDGERKIYAGSAVTVGALLLFLLTFVLKHGLSKAATKDLLDLLNFAVPGCVPKSLRCLKKHLTDYNDKTEIHLYCPKCANYLGVEPGNECGVCQQRLSKKVLLEKAYYFLVMPLEIQLRNILAHVHSKLGKHFTKNSSVSDVNTGSAYKHDKQANSITLTFRCDGSPLLNTPKFSVWPILCTINELPYVERCKNVLLNTLWFGRGKPQVQSFFTPFINELHKLSGEGFIWKDETGSEHHTRVKAKICVCNSVARPMVQNFQPFNREFGCGFCYHRGEMVQKGRGYTRVYPIQIDGCDLRHMAETEQLAELVLENSYEQGQMGVKGPSPLLLLPSFDIIKGFIPDYMHCFCLGVVPEFVNLWFNPLYTSKRFHLTPQHLKDLDKALCAIQPPNEVKQSPRRLSERMYWKASEWRAFALLYSPVILKNALPKLYYEHWMLLICAFHFLLSQFATQDELSYAELCLGQFVAQVPSLYGLEHCSFNCHLLTHLTESVRNWGLLWANSAFVFEGTNSRLLQMYSGTQSLSSQIFTQLFSFEEVIRKGGAVLQNSSTEMKDFFCSMTSFDTVSKSSNYTGEHVVTLGCGSQRSLTSREITALQSNDTKYQQNQGYVTEYKCFVCSNMLVTTVDYSVTCKRNNSAIETTSGFAIVESVVVIPKPCSCEEASNCSCRQVVAFCRKLLRTSSQPTIYDTQINTNVAKFLIRVRSSNELCAVACGDIVAKCCVIEQEGRLYVMRMPVF
ncbi:uncharacterized protein [Leuresthes tenuis]|uniref:uncharacterized protein n=1 Tax=Leuresthes tenuis TaxID=355514 RepID=UPI003B501332